MSTCRRLILLATLLGGLGTAATPASAAPLLGFIDPTYASTEPTGFWRDVAVLRPRILRNNLRWTFVAPTEPLAPRDPGDPAYRWDLFDAWVRDTAAHGVEPLVTIWLTPDWAKRYRDVPGPQTVARPQAFRDFAAAAALRYSGTYDPDGGGPAEVLPRVTRWEIGNEPNRYLYPMRRAGRLTIARDYTAMLNAAYAEIHALGDALGYVPQVAAGSFCKANQGFRMLAPLRFLAMMRRWGARFDALSIHPYSRYPRLGVRDGVSRGSTTAPNVAVGNFSDLPRALDRLWRGRRIRIWITEFAWEAARTPNEHVVTPAEQARYLAQSLAIFRRPRNRVDVLVWFLLRDEPRRYPDGHRGWESGLRYVNGTVKPAFAAWIRHASRG